MSPSLQIATETTKALPVTCGLMVLGLVLALGTGEILVRMWSFWRLASGANVDEEQGEAQSEELERVE